MVACAKICSRLGQELEEAFLPVSLHSRFANAANIRTPMGLVSILASWKCLQPYALVLKEPWDFRELGQGELKLCRRGLWQNGEVLISFSGARQIDLRRPKKFQPVSGAGETLRQFLSSQREKGIVSLIFQDGGDNLYTHFLEPRIRSFREAMRKRDVKDSVRLAAQTAGGFSAVFQQELEKAEGRQVAFSKHAMARAEERGIEVTPTLLDRLSDSVERAEAKGATNILALDQSLAFIINVPHGRVITTLSQDEMKENVFTNIDGAVIL